MGRTTIVGCAAVLACACAGGRTAQDFADRADQYARQGRYSAAVIEYRNAVKQDPGRADVHYKLAETLTALGQTEGAFTAYREACRLAPGNVDACLAAARLLLAGGRAGEAERQAQAVLRTDPRNVDALLVLGAALAESGRSNLAVQQFEKAIAVDHRPAAYAALGRAWAKLGDLRAAEAAYRAGVTHAPDSGEARANLAAFLLSTDRPEAAETELLEATRRAPDDELANRALASLYTATERTAEAEPYLVRAAAQPDQRHGSLLALADYYGAAERWDEARAVLDRAPAEGALALAARVRRAAIAYETGDTAAAHDMLEAVLARQRTPEALAVRAQFLAREARLDEALDAARTAVALQPRHAGAYRIIAAVEQARGNVREAEAARRAAGRGE